MTDIDSRLPAHVRVAVENSAYELFVTALSVLAISNLVMVYLIRDPALETILVVMNGLFSVIFFFDFLYRARSSDSFSAYFLRRFGWADLLSSLPFPPLKFLRLFRLVHALRLFVAAGGRATWNRLSRDRATSALMTLLLLGVLVLEFGSLLILRIEEHAAGASIVTASDALWYVIVTIATVGYGDQYPVTDMGRLAGGVIIVIGVGIFGTFTGFLTNFFLAPRRRRRRAQTDARPEEPIGLGETTAPAEPAGFDAARFDDLASDSDRTARLELLLAQSRTIVTELEHLLGRDGDDRGREVVR